MNFTKHNEVFSQNRMQKYLAGAKNNQVKAVEFYKHNLLISQSLYPLISILEVGLRNAIDRTMRSHFKRSDWLLSEKRGFFIHPNLTYRESKTGHVKPDTYFFDKVFGVEQRLRKAGEPVMHNKIMADLSFHFWVRFFDEKPFKILAGAPMSAFKNNPRLGAKDVVKLLNEIRHLRNRISHHEPICFDNKGSFCIRYALQKYLQIQEAIRWIDGDLLMWSQQFDGVMPKLHAALAIA